MTKLSKRFQFTYPITEKSVINGIKTKTLMGNIAIEGVGYEDTNTNTFYPTTIQEDKYDFDIDVMKIQGTDIGFLKNLLSDGLIEDIHKEAHKQVMRMFYEEHMQELYHQMQLESQTLIN